MDNIVYFLPTCYYPSSITLWDHMPLKCSLLQSLWETLNISTHTDGCCSVWKQLYSPHPLHKCVIWHKKCVQHEEAVMWKCMLSAETSAQVQAPSPGLRWKVGRLRNSCCKHCEQEWRGSSVHCEWVLWQCDRGAGWITSVCVAGTNHCCYRCLFECLNINISSSTITYICWRSL